MYVLISPLISVQSSNQSVYSMFALQHGEISETRSKQSACCIQCKHNLYVYTSFFEFILNSSFFIAPRSRRGISTFIIYCVSCHFLICYMTYWYNLFFSVFSGAQLGCAPARRFSLRVNPGILNFL